MPVAILQTTGRRSGKARATPVVYLRRGDDIVIVPASAGSSPAPQWWRNLSAAGEGVVEIAGERFGVVPRRAEGAERNHLWAAIVDAYPDVAHFERYAGEELKLVILKRADSGARTWNGTPLVGGSQLGPVHQAMVGHGPIQYHDIGDGPVLLFVHGLWVNGDLWRKVVPLLRDRYRCVVPHLPFGGHRAPLHTDADLRPTGVARLLDEFMGELGLEDVTVIANDTGDAYAQVLVTTYPEKISRLVLTPGDAFTNFLPYSIKPMRPLAQLPGGTRALAKFWRSRLGKALIMGPLTKRRPKDEVLESYFGPADQSRAIRRDLRRLLAHASPRATLRAARRLRAFRKPVLVVWTRRRNLVFPLRHGRRLAKLLPLGRLELVDDSYVFISEDRPDLLAALIEEFVPVAEAAPATTTTTPPVASPTERR